MRFLKECWLEDPIEHVGTAAAPQKYSPEVKAAYVEMELSFVRFLGSRFGGNTATVCENFEDRRSGGTSRLNS